MAKEKVTPKFIKLYTRGRWVYLFFALIALLVVYPYVEESEYGQAPLVLYLLKALVVLAIIYEVSYTKWQFFLALMIALPSLFFNWFPETDAFRIIRIFLDTLLYVYAIFMILSILMPQQSADIETIYGAISLYILLGLCWANLYGLIELMSPSSFVFSNPAILRPFEWSDYLYYSFVTLTTLGYGDIVPIAPQARSCAILEAIAGVIFIAVMVSKTVGLYVSSVRAEDKKGV